MCRCRSTLCDRADAALKAVPTTEWTLDELEQFALLLESFVAARLGYPSGNGLAQVLNLFGGFPRLEDPSSDFVKQNVD